MKFKKRVLNYLLKRKLYPIFHFYIRSFSASPFQNRIKKCLLELMGAKIGKNVFIYSGVFIADPNGLIIGDNAVVSKDVVITATGGVHIGDNVLIGYGSKIISANHIIPKTREIPIRFSGHECKPIEIKNDSWICANAVVVPGVTIGKGAVVAAGAVLSKNVPDYEVYGGIPAKMIKMREFDD